MSEKRFTDLPAFSVDPRTGMYWFWSGSGDCRKNSKNWDTLNYYRDCPTNGIVGFYSAILRSKDADRHKQSRH